MEIKMNDKPLSQGQLIKLVSVRLLLLVPLLFAMFFLPAGTIYYWEAWLYLAVLLIPMFFVLLYLLKNDPGLLERRMRLREKEAQQKRIIKLSYLYFIGTFLLPGFDQRFGWSEVPVWVVLVADAVVFLASHSSWSCGKIAPAHHPGRAGAASHQQWAVCPRPPPHVRGSLSDVPPHPAGAGLLVGAAACPADNPHSRARILNEEKTALELNGYPNTCSGETSPAPAPGRSPASVSGKSG
jgi:hypothetical protein